MTRAQDLPPKLQRAIAKGQVLATKQELAALIPDRATSRARGQLRPGARYRCHTCGAMFTKWAPVERHMDGHGGGRIVEFPLSEERVMALGIGIAFVWLVAALSFVIVMNRGK